MLPFFETPNRKVKAAQSLKKKLNKQNTRTLVYAVSESHRTRTDISSLIGLVRIKKVKSEFVRLSSSKRRRRATTRRERRSLYFVYIWD